SALKWWPHYKLRRIDALILTHPHADAINGLDDLRAWTLNKMIQDNIPIYLTRNTMEAIKTTFPYIVDNRQATGSVNGGGDLPAFTYNIIDVSTPFTIEGLEFIPLEAHHGVYLTTNEPYIYVGFRFDNISYVSDCNFIPKETLEKMEGSEIVILDALDREKHSSHFSIGQAIDTSRNLNPKPKRTYLVGFAHRIEHYSLTREMEELQKNEPDLWVRPAHDGLRVGMEELLPKQSYLGQVLRLIFGASN
ncbi:1991_t:CDS:2, partial [Paraglomus occultum]